MFSVVSLSFSCLNRLEDLMGGRVDGWEERSGNEKLDVIDILCLILQEFG